MGLRGDAILQLDWTVGQLTHALDSLGLTKNTMIIFSSDNGPVLNDGYLDQAAELVGSHKPGGPLRGGKYRSFEAGARVPLIVKWPAGIAKPAVSDALIGQVDFFASLAKLTGQPLADGDAPDSFDMLQQLLGKSRQDRPYLITQGGPLSIIEGDYKYITPSKGARVAADVNIELGNDPGPQLYNIRKDVFEKNNLAEKDAARANAMAEKLKAVKAAGSSR